MENRMELSPRKEREGMILVVALLIMAVLSIAGATALTTSRIDIQISQNTKVSRQAFYFADGGLEMSPKLIRSMIEQGAIFTGPGYALDTGGTPVPGVITMNPTLFLDIMGYTGTDNTTDSVDPVNSPDVQTRMGDTQLKFDIDKSGTGFMAGSGVEFGAGAEGAGAGTTGGVLIFYNIASLGEAPTNAQSLLEVYYRLVVGVAGGK